MRRGPRTPEGMDPEPEPPLDHLGRPAVGQDIKFKITEAMKTIDPDKRGALLVIADTGPDGKVQARAHLAAKLGEHWKVAAGAGWKLGESRPSGYVSVEASW